MGVLNVTPDSFSDGGDHLDPDAAVRAGLAMAAAGADILDVGGESTRPGADPVSAAEEIARVVPVIRRLAQATSVPISVDTYKAATAAAALEAGARLVNDIGGLRLDPELAYAVAARGAGLVVAHSRGSPRDMQVGVEDAYADVVGEVRDFLAGAVARAVEAGVDGDAVAVDPGIGFGKTLAHNLALLRALPALAPEGRPVLVGTSRKSYLGALTGRPAAERGPATVASVAAAVLGGAHLVRVHDVAAAVDACRVAEALR